MEWDWRAAPPPPPPRTERTRLEQYADADPDGFVSRELLENMPLPRVAGLSLSLLNLRLTSGNRRGKAGRVLSTAQVCGVHVVRLGRRSRHVP